MKKANLRLFLNSAVIDPTDRKQPILSAIIAEGNAHHFELKAMELIQEASRIRVRIEESGKRDAATLLDFYREKMRLSATYLSLAVEMTNERFSPTTQVKARSKDPASIADVPEGP